MAKDSGYSEQNVQEIQMLQHNMQQLLMEKQSIQVAINELENALRELHTAKEPVYKSLGNIMIRADKSILIQELEEKKKMQEVRISSMEKQEKSLEDKSEKLRKSFISSSNKQS